MNTRSIVSELDEPQFVPKKDVSVEEMEDDEIVSWVEEILSKYQWK
jgi:hypothetical protein